DIDEVIQVIRTSDDAAAARERLMSVFDLSETQANYILDMPLRRLTKFSRLELEAEQESLRATIAALTEIIESDRLLRETVSGELAEVAKKFGTPRRTVLLESAGVPTTSAVPLEVRDDPCWVLLSSTGLLARTLTDDPLPTEGGRAKHDVVVSVVRATARGDVAAVTSAGRMVRLGVLDVPAVPATASAPHLSGGAPVSEFLSLDRDEQVLGLCSLSTEGAGLALGTEQGVVKRVMTDYPQNRDSWEVVSLKDGDRVAGAVELGADDDELVFVTSDAQLLHFPASAVRPQGRAAGGMAGVRLATGARVVFFGTVPADQDAAVVTVAGSSSALPGTDAGSVKVTPFTEYPSKGRGTGGVRCHRFLRGEDVLTLAWAGTAPPRAAAATGVAVDLPAATGKRDGSGVAASQPLAAVSGPAVGR
ncbi:MAG TPA: DNA gyrase C-terminal beta-propeller domain-containing protein, partial [Actinomycetes bacterium]